MPVSYTFSTPPQFDYSNSRVILSLEDFYKIMKLAEDQLNILIPVAGPGQFLDSQQENHQNQISEKVVPVDSPKEHLHLGPDQKLQQKQAQLSASFANVLSRITQFSNILNTPEGQNLGNTPLHFLAPKLDSFKSVWQIFSTQSSLPETKVARDFHTACDHKPNVLVIIKSGQYIAGGFSSVAFESHAGNHWKANPDGYSFLFSVNKQKIYSLKNKDKALNCNKDLGPVFGHFGFVVFNNYAQKNNWEQLYDKESSFHDATAEKGELFGSWQFGIDAYEVFQLK